MRIRLLSDLHLEFSNFVPPPAQADVVVLAGDIEVGPELGVRWARYYFPDTPVLIVCGNHEFYGQHLENSLEYMKEIARGESNIHVLENDELVIDNTRFLGATLWSDFALLGWDRIEHDMAYCANWMNDFHRIACGPEDKPRQFMPPDAAMLHARSVRWLKEKLNEPHNGRTVVVTHHAPHAKSLAPCFARDPASAAFVSNLDRLMGPPVDVWLHGHTHSAYEYAVRGTRVYCNPRGYFPHEQVPGFDPALVVEV